MPYIVKKYDGVAVHLGVEGETLCGHSVNDADIVACARIVEIKLLVTCNKCRNHQVFKDWYLDGQK
jgi:hypothetical protein